MAEVGIDIAGEVPKRLSVEAVESSDVVITMGCGDACPVFPGIAYRDWDLPDPAGQGIEAVRAIRDEIRGRIEALLAELSVGLATTSGSGGPRSGEPRSGGPTPRVAL